MVTIIEEHICSYSIIRGGSFAELWWRPIHVSELTSENSSNVTGQCCISWEELLFITSTKNMGQERLTGLALMNAHREIEVDVDKVIYRFAKIVNRILELVL